MLSGTLRFSPHVASVMAARCTAVTSLMLNCWSLGTGDDDSSSEGAESEDAEWAAAPPPAGEDLAAADMARDDGRSLGRIPLLQELGPRLTELSIYKATGWRPEALAAVRHCRALTKLCIDAGEDDPVDLECEDVPKDMQRPFGCCQVAVPPAAVGMVSQCDELNGIGCEMRCIRSLYVRTVRQSGFRGPLTRCLRACNLRVCYGMMRDCPDLVLFLPQPTGQTTLLESISQLPQLQDLNVSVYCRPPAPPLTAIPARDAISFSNLSALTALTRLHLDSQHYWLQDATEQRTWWQHSLAQHGALVAALRHMPHLASFESTTLTLSVSDLAALTSLTNVELAVLTPPELQLHQSAAAAPTCRDGVAHGGAAMGGQPRLVKLSTWDDRSSSPRVLARLNAFPFLRELRLGLLESPSDICFGPADVAPWCTQLLPDTPYMVQQAVNVMADVRARGQQAAAGLGFNGVAAGRLELSIGVNAELVPGLLLPPAPAPFPPSPAGGHAAWLRELAPLALPGQGVRLWGLALAAGDLAAMAETFPEAKVWQGRLL